MAPATIDLAHGLQFVLAPRAGIDGSMGERGSDGAA